MRLLSADRDRTRMIFELWRQDDNGNRFLVGSYASRPQAEKRLGELTLWLHKAGLLDCGAA